MLLSIIFLLLGYKEEVSSSKLRKEVEAFYQIDVKVIKADLPRSAYYAPNKRYRADSILNYLKRTYPNDRVVAITSVDISTTKNGIKDYGIFGLGSLRDDVCITSVYRLKSKNLYQRTLKVCLHEIGHTLGINHCTTDQTCFMKEGDHTAKGLDKDPIVMCDRCHKKAFRKLSWW